MSDLNSHGDPIGRSKLGTGSRPKDVLLWGSFVAAVLATVGSLGPWAELGPLTIGGLDADDGLITIVLAILAGGLIGARLLGSRRLSLIVSSIAFDIIAVAGIVDWADVSRMGGAEQVGIEVSVGWGLMLVTVAGIGGAVLSVAAWSLDRRDDRRAAAPEEPESRGG